MNIHNPNKSHLGENDILQAVIDDTDLSMLQQQHLQECSQCRSQKERLENELAPSIMRRNRSGALLWRNKKFGRPSLTKDLLLARRPLRRSLSSSGRPF